MKASQMADGPSTQEGLQRAVDFDGRVFSVQSVKEAAYRFSDRVAIAVELDGERIRCQLVPVKPLAVADIDALETSFRIEVLDCDLRNTLRRETEPLRNFVLSLAFSKAGLDE